jgi:hypothetical protein
VSFQISVGISHGASRRLRSQPIVTVNRRGRNTKAAIATVAATMEALAALQQADSEIWGAEHQGGRRQGEVITGYRFRG